MILAALRLLAEPLALTAKARLVRATSLRSVPFLQLLCLDLK